MLCSRAVPPPGYHHHSIEDALLQHSGGRPGKPDSPGSKPSRRPRKPLEDITHLYAYKSSRLQHMR